MLATKPLFEYPVTPLLHENNASAAACALGWGLGAAVRAWASCSLSPSVSWSAART